MTLSDDDRRLLGDSLDRFVAASYDAAAFKVLAGTREPALGPHWRTYASLGWLGLGMPEEAGGAGLGDAGLARLMEAAGKGLLLEPLLNVAVISAGLIATLGNAEQQAMLAGVTAGTVVPILAHGEPGAGFDRDRVATTARADGDGWRLDGAKAAVLDAPMATHLLVTACDGDGRLGLYAVPANARGVSLSPFRTVDARWSAGVRLDAVRVPASARLDGEVSAVLDAALDRAAVMVMFEALGCMDVVVADTQAYLKTRTQFGQPLARFQVLQHRLVDMYVAAQEARATATIALDALDAPAPERIAAVATAKTVGCRAARLVGQQAVQLHGGMGMTDELMIGHRFKRLMQAEALFGNEDFHLDRYMRVAGSVDAAA